MRQDRRRLRCRAGPWRGSACRRNAAGIGLAVSLVEERIVDRVPFGNSDEDDHAGAVKRRETREEVHEPPFVVEVHENERHQRGLEVSG